MVKVVSYTSFHLVPVQDPVRDVQQGPAVPSENVEHSFVSSAFIIKLAKQHQPSIPEGNRALAGVSQLTRGARTQGLPGPGNKLPLLPPFQ